MLMLGAGCATPPIVASDAKVAMRLLDQGLSVTQAVEIVNEARATLRSDLETIDLAVVRVLERQAQRHADYADDLIETYLGARRVAA